VGRYQESLKRPHAEEKKETMKWLLSNCRVLNFDEVEMILQTLEYAMGKLKIDMYIFM